MEFVSIVFYLFIMCAEPPFMQIMLFEVNPEYFKKIKIKKCSFMFRGIGGKDCIYGSAKDYGVIIPMFVMQVLGYVFALLSLILFFVLYFAFAFQIATIIMIFTAILLFESLISIATAVICAMITKKKDKKLKKHYIEIKNTIKVSDFIKGAQNDELNAKMGKKLISAVDCLKYLIDTAESLAYIDKQSELMEKLKDYYTIDIATEWDYEYFKNYLNMLQDTIDIKIINELITTISNNFSREFSQNNKTGSEIWTLEALNKHDFWKTQKELADKLLKLLLQNLRQLESSEQNNN